MTAPAYSVRKRRAVALILSIWVLQACSLQGLNFVEDERVEITAPDDRAQVQLPVTVSWEVTDFEVTGPDGSDRPGAGYFGVFVDRAPPHPGETVQVLIDEELEGDAGCRRDPECPDARYLAGIGIHTTDGTSVTLERLDDPFPSSDRRELHEATIVFLNGKGERIGESAFRVEFEVMREG